MPAQPPLRAAHGCCFRIWLAGLVLAAGTAGAAAQQMPALRMGLPALRDTSFVPPTLQMPGADSSPVTSTAAAALPAPPRPSTAPKSNLAVPYAFQVHPFRRSPGEGAEPYTLRLPGESGLEAQLRLGLQSSARFDSNINNTPHAERDAILDWTPFLRLTLGTPLEARSAGVPASDYLVDVEYLPTYHQQLLTASSVPLNRVRAEVARDSGISRIALRLDYDESPFAASPDASREDATSSLQLSASAAYNLSAKTTIHVTGNYREITGSKTSSIDSGWDCATSPVTKLGFGAEVGKIDFDGLAARDQQYEIGYLACAWHPSVLLGLETRAGVQDRIFEGSSAGGAKVSPVVSAILNWQPAARTQVDAGFRLQEAPSTLRGGTTYQETRFGADLTQELLTSCYTRLETQYIRRRYDGGDTEAEWSVRPAFGYRTALSRGFNSLTVELYYQYRGGEEPDFSRQIVGIQSTICF